MSSLEAGIDEVRYFTDPRHTVLHERQDTFGPNIGVDGRNLTILFLSLNRALLSIRLIRSILEHMPRFAGEILIADNGSDAVEIEAIKTVLKHCPLRWRLLEFGRNYGVAGGRNRAIAEVRTDWVMSLDNDIFFIANPLQRIQRDLAVLGCHFLNLPLLNPDRETLYAFGGHLQTLVQNGRPRLTMTTVLRPQTPTSAVSEIFKNGEAFLCSFLFGGASVLNRHSFNALGQFDEAMLIGFEDLDFSLRLFRAGMKVGSSSVLALVHDHPKADTFTAEEYERIRYSRKILEASARHLEAKHGYVIWGDEINLWLSKNEKLQGFDTAIPTAGQTPRCEPSESTPRRKPRIALVTDTDNWAFANISSQLRRYLGSRYDFEVIPLVQLAEIEEARSHARQGQGPCAPGGASAFGQALLLAEGFDIVHVFWREFLTIIDTPLLQGYAASLGMTYERFRGRFIENKVISTSVYDHLFLEPEAVAQRQRLFNEVISGYYVSSERLAAIYQNIPGYPPPDAILEDGVDLTVFRPKKLERFDDLCSRDGDWASSRREIVIGWVGNSKWAAPLEDFKGVHTILIPAVEALRAEGLPLRLHLADRQNGYIPHHKMPDYYAEIDLYVCTSKIEGTPNPVLEAMACGVPVITTDVGIVPQAFGPLQRQFILQERSIECLKEALRRLIASPEMFRQLSTENLESIRAWDWSVRAEKFASYWNLLLRRKYSADGETRTKICLLPFTTPSVETDGSIRLCSAASIFAYRDETNMGNSRELGLEAVWRGEKYRHVRRTLASGEGLTPWCSTCEYRFDGPVWLLQLHLALHAWHNDIRSEAVKELIAARRHRYDEYRRLAPQLLLPVLSLPEDLPQVATGVAGSIKPLAPSLPEELVDGRDLPIYLDLNTLNRCNVSCVMCPPAIRFDSRQKTRDPYYRLTLDEYKKLTQGLRIKSSHFVGAYAEPLLNKEIFDLIRYAHANHSFTAITSNGMALSRNFAERLLDAGLDMLTISLHGARRETAEAVMRKSNFDRIVGNIRGLQALKKERGLTKPEIYFNYVGMKTNVMDLPDFMQLAASLEVKHVHFIHLIDGDDVVDKGQSLLDEPGLLTQYVDEALRRARELGVNLYVSSAYQEAIDRYRATRSRGARRRVN